MQRVRSLAVGQNRIVEDMGLMPTFVLRNSQKRYYLVRGFLNHFSGRFFDYFDPDRDKTTSNEQYLFQFPLIGTPSNSKSLRSFDFYDLQTSNAALSFIIKSSSHRRAGNKKKLFDSSDNFLTCFSCKKCHIQPEGGAREAVMLKCKRKKFQFIIRWSFRDISDHLVFGAQPQL